MSRTSSIVGALAVAASLAAAAAAQELLKASYDPTRELYQDLNAAFTRHWKEKAWTSRVMRNARIVVSRNEGEANRPLLITQLSRMRERLSL